MTVEVGGKGAVPTGETNPGTRTPSGPHLMPHLFSLPSLSSSSTADELSPCDRTGAQDVAGTQSHDRDTSVSCQHTCLRRKDSDGSNLDRSCMVNSKNKFIERELVLGASSVLLSILRITLYGPQRGCKASYETGQL